MAATLGGVNLDNIQSITQSKSGNIMPITIPMADSNETEVFDLGGNLEVVELDGFYTSDSVANTKTKVDALMALFDGSQDTAISLITDQTGTLSVKIAELSISWSIGDTPTSVVANYGLKLLRST